jgi:hypothetical protein
MRRRLRGLRARFVSSWFALLERHEQQPCHDKSRRRDPAPIRAGFNFIAISELQASFMDIVLSHKIASVAELAGESATSNSMFLLQYLYQDMMIAPGMSPGIQASLC